MTGYTITQVAEQLGIKVHTIRYWEKNVPMLSAVERDEYGKRLYNRQDVYLLIRLKYYIEEKHFTLKGASDELIKEMAGGKLSKEREFALNIMKNLGRQRERLEEARRVLKESKKNTENSVDDLDEA